MFHTGLIHILVGFYLPPTFLSSLFQQVCTQSFQTFTTLQWLFHSSMHFLYNYFAQVNTSQRFITVFTICIHILGIWSPYNLSFIGCFVEFMYTIINHFKPLRSFYDCFYKSMHFLYKITSHKLQYFHLDSTVYHLSPFSQPHHVVQASYYTSYHCTSRVTHSKLNSLSPS